MRSMINGLIKTESCALKSVDAIVSFSIEVMSINTASPINCSIEYNIWIILSEM